MSTQRSLPTPRKEGMANIVAATLRLLESHEPQDITLRDVARESGHGHRLIVEWFGGKGGLFAAVFAHIFTELASSGALYTADVILRREVRIAFGLFNYMQMNHREFVQTLKGKIVIGTMQERMSEVLGLSPERALLAAKRLSLVALGGVLFNDFIDLTNDELIRLIQDEFQTSTGHQFLYDASRLTDETN